MSIFGIASTNTENANDRKVFKKPPFRIDEKGWGEFDMSIVLTAVGKGGDHTLEHDLNFQSERYEAKHQVVSVEKKIDLHGGHMVDKLDTDIPES